MSAKEVFTVATMMFVMKGFRFGNVTIAPHRPEYCMFCEIPSPSGARAGLESSHFRLGRTGCCHPFLTQIRASVVLKGPRVARRSMLRWTGGNTEAWTSQK